MLEFSQQPDVRGHYADGDPVRSSDDVAHNIEGSAAGNQGKHGLSFEEAAEVFLDPLALTFDDPDHSDDERRFITIGVTTNQRVVFVSHADGGDDRIRIISARETTRCETYDYEERSRKHQ